MYLMYLYLYQYTDTSTIHTGLKNVCGKNTNSLTWEVPEPLGMKML